MKYLLAASAATAILAFGSAKAADLVPAPPLETQQVLVRLDYRF